MDFTTIFTDPGWKLSTAIAYPNQLGRLDQDGDTIGVVIVLRGRGQDFALGVAGLEYLIKAEQEGRITTGYVVLAQANGERPEFIAAEKAAVVYERLRKYIPRDGKLGLGSYWWITVDFMPAMTMKLNPNAPF
jgi:hypothetical protein